MILKESPVYPYEGYFWIIDGKVVGITAEVLIHNYEYNLNGKTHENSWAAFKDDYLVDGKTVDWDYFPRGRVMVDPEYHLDGSFDYYTCFVFLDKCINNKECKEAIVDYYNLNIPTIPHITWTMLGERAGIDHYTCHNCKKK